MDDGRTPTIGSRWTALPSLAAISLLALALAGHGCADYSAGELEDDDSAAGDDDMAGDDDSVSDDDTGDDDTGDDDTVQDTGPCGDGSWGDVPLDEGELIVVTVDGSQSGNGTLAAPYDTLDTALAAARALGDPATIALGPGSHAAAAELTEVAGDFTDQGLIIAGCSPAETKLVAADPAQPAIAVRAVDDVTLTSLTIEGGRPAVLIHDGAGAGAPIVLSGVEVQYAVGAGIVVDDILGGDSAAALTDVEVSGTTLDDGAGGWGISVQRARATIEGGRVASTTGVGIFGHLAEVQIDGTTVESIAADGDGRLGRGVHLQMMSSGSVRNATVSGCADAGIYVHMGMGLTLESNVVTGSTGAALPDVAETSGDGIVVTMGDEAFSPEYFQTTLLGNTASDNARAGILIDGAWTHLTGNGGTDNIFDPGGWGIVVQDQSVVEGTDSVFDVDADPMVDPVMVDAGELNWMQVGGS